MGKFAASSANGSFDCRVAARPNLQFLTNFTRWCSKPLKPAVGLEMSKGGFVPQTVNSPSTRLQHRSECRQCGLRLQHLVLRLDGGFGPGMTPQSRQTIWDAAIDLTAGVSPTCTFDFSLRVLAALKMRQAHDRWCCHAAEKPVMQQ